MPDPEPAFDPALGPDSDLALDPVAVCAALGSRVAALDVVAVTGSTNADLLAAARAGAPDRTVLVAERQNAGRGRLDRRWISGPGTGLTFSVLLRPSGVPGHRLGWLPLLTGLSVVRALRDLAPGLPVWVKWPNDVLCGPGQAKCAGILAEADPAAAGGPAVVVGVGLNVHASPDELLDGATSLRAEGARDADGAPIGRAAVLTAVLTRLLDDQAAWRAAGGDPDVSGVRAAYTGVCATLGRRVRVELPGASRLEAVAERVDTDGRLTVRDAAGGTTVVAAGDVVHLRALPS